MANAVSAVSGLSALDQSIRSESAKPQTQTSAIPKDTVTLSQTAKPASTATTTTAKTSGDVDHDGDSA
jgi:hypothetical protein